MATVEEVKKYADEWPTRFKAEMTEGYHYSYQYYISDLDFQFTFLVDDGELKMIYGPWDGKPTCRFIESSDIYCKINAGELDATQAYMMRKVKMEGQMAVGSKFLRFFDKGRVKCK